jgi:hypothetical protein
VKFIKKYVREPTLSSKRMEIEEYTAPDFYDYLKRYEGENSNISYKGQFDIVSKGKRITWHSVKIDGCYKDGSHQISESEYGMSLEKQKQYEEMRFEIMRQNKLNRILK